MKYVDMILPFFMKNITSYPSIKRITVNQSLFYVKALHSASSNAHKCVKIQNNQSCMHMANGNHLFLKAKCGYLQRNLCTELNYLNNSPNKVLTLLENSEFINEAELNAKLFLDLLFNEEKLTVIEWDTLKQKLLHYKLCTESNFNDEEVMNIIYKKNNYRLAEAFLQYLQEKKQEPNVATLSVYLQLCRYNVELCGDEAILNVYKDITSKVKILDSTTRSSIVQALCVTKYWMIAYDVVNKNPSVFSECENYRAVASAAFKHNRTDIALELVQKIDSLGGKMNEGIYIQWLKSALSNQSELHQLLERLFTHLSFRNILLPVTCVEKLQECFKSLENEKWTSKLVNINRKGICSNCNHLLSCIDITPDQFKKMKEAFFYRMRKSTDPNLKQEELNKFLNFVKQTAPYDLVIDGPNVAFHQARKTSEEQAMMQLYQVVKHFARDKNMKLLILGRKYMEKWSRIQMSSIEKMAHVFYADFISHDDPFMIYAAIYSKQNTLVMTKNILRNHKFFFYDPTLATYFERWRINHQIFLEDVHKETGEVKYKDPLRHSITAQGNMADSWHIPYDDNKERDPSDICEQWLCLRKIK